MRILRNLTLALVVGVGSIAFASAAPAQDEVVTTTTTKHHYVYYDAHQIYFAPETKVYYWREGDAWRSGVELPPIDRQYVRTGGVEVDLDTDRPYERHDWVIAHMHHPKDRIHHDDND